MSELGSGLKVQQSSAELMGYMVQDLLDYAQIKAGKFRKRMSPFNIREAVEQVLCIQRQRAEEKQIQLLSEFPNFKETDMSGGEGYSPILYCDKERIM